MIVVAAACSAGATARPRRIARPPPPDRCAATARRLAAPGVASAATRRRRIDTATRPCTADRWPERVLDCAATADLDTDAQRDHWSGAFARWLDPTGK